MEAVLAHTLRGDGPRAILLLHGFLGSGRNLNAVARRWSALDPGVRLVLVDLLGHGRSPKLPPGADLATQAEAILELARHLALPGPLAITGHSLGGRVALAAALLDPGAVGEVNLLDISPSPLLSLPSGPVVSLLLEAPDRAPSRQAMIDWFTARGLSQGLADWLAMNLEGHGELTWRIDRRALAEFHQRIAADDLWPAVERRTVRVRALRGGDSSYVGDADLERLRAAGAEVETLPGTGHFLHADAPDAVVAFLARRGA